MKAERLPVVVNLYVTHLEGMGLEPKEFTQEEYRRLITGMPLLEHCLWMLHKMRAMLKEKVCDTEKLLGWMGFIQGCFAFGQIFTVQELRDQSRS